jgi:ankyrin repeat protein
MDMQFQRKNNIQYISNLNVLEALFPYGLNFNLTDKQGKTILHDWVTYSKDFPRVKFALQHGANVNARDDTNRTPLSYVYDPKMKELLLSYGATL